MRKIAHKLLTRGTRAVIYAIWGPGDHPLAAGGKLIVTAAAFLIICGTLYAGTSALSDATGVQALTREVRGQLSPRHHTVLSSELPALITALDLREGESFKKGKTLVVFDCEVYNAQLQKARAAEKAAECSHKVNKRLDQLDAVSTLEVEQTENRLAEASAHVRVMQVQVSKCEIRAPFSGRIVKRFAEPYQYATAGTPLLEILNPDDLEIQLIVPSGWLTWLDKKTTFDFYVEENKRIYTARVVRMGTRVDPVSQSVSVVGKISGASSELLPGMSGLARFQTPSENQGATP